MPSFTAPQLGGRLGRIQAYATAAAPVVLAGKAVWDAYKSRPKKEKSISLLFRENDEAYQWLIDWIADHPDRNASDTFLVCESRNRSSGSLNSCVSLCDPGEDSDRKPTRSAQLIPIKEFKFTFGSTRCSVNKPDQDLDPPSEKRKSALLPNEMMVRFETKDFSVCAAFVEEIQTKAKEKSKEPPKVYFWRNYQGWSVARTCPPSRTVILPEGILPELISDMRRFHSRREWYEHRGIPHRRGYLLHGSPGSGKTSTVLCAANELDCNIYWVALSDMSDSLIMDALQRVPSGGIVLLEDIDCAFDARDKKEGDERLTFSGLLNALDGVASQEGRIVIMTTNHIDRLDPALIRPGRIDRKIEFGQATRDQLEEIARRFFGETPEVASLADEWAAEGISMAAAQERLIHRGTLEGTI